MKPFLIGALVVLASCGSLSHPPPATVSEADAAQGIREALDQGVGKGIATLNKKDGFFGNPSYKLLLPAETQTIENSLRQIGMVSLVDRTILQINRAAENAVGAAGPIFSGAIRNMPVTDAIGLLKGPKDAATQYFRRKTTDQLILALTPIVKSSLDQFSATKFYGDMLGTYNGFPTTVNKLNPDLNGYVVRKTIDALFDQVAREEANIRSNASARSSDLLKRDFGWAAKN